MVIEMDNDNNYIVHVAESKALYHKNKAKASYEEKVRIIIELQKINNEMLSKKKRKNNRTIAKVWDSVL